MNMNEIGKIGKILKEQQEIGKSKKTGTPETDFSKILEEEIAQKTQKTRSSEGVIPTKNLLNIKQSSSEEIFIRKGIEKLSEMTDNLEKFKNIILSKNFNVSEANNLIKLLRENIGHLNTILNNIQNQDVKNDINKAILISNVEIEKYLRGDYF